ncbi:MAG TPA: BT_3928 family protein [Puia sp.]|nr:BT_3928 family protein [Puia sp.]
MKQIIAVTRGLVGVLFIFSGMVKADDPLGLSYKMQEFFDVWGIHWLDHLTLTFAMIMIVFEIVAGVAVLVGWRMRLFSWLLLLLMIFFTFLTGYAYLSGKVRECGCFGDCIPLTAGESFLKDLVLMVLVVFLFAMRHRIRPLLPPVISVAVLAAATLFAFILQGYVLRHLPVVDCLPYKKGTHIIEQMKIPPGAVPDSTVITMVYQKNGQKVEFDASHFPKDFDDSYKFVSRYDKVVREGNAVPAIKDFVLTTDAGTDTTQDVLSARGYKLFEFVRELNDDLATQNFSIILTAAKARHIPVYIITADYDDVVNKVRQIGIASDVTVLKCDAIAVKTAARVNPTLYLLKNDLILGKWSYADIDKAIPAVNESQNQEAAAIQ